MVAFETPSSEGTGAACLEPRLSKPRLTGPEASDYIAQKFGLKVSPKTLDTKRTRGGGPEFEKFGRAVMYKPEHIDKWISDNLSPSRCSTSEGGR